MADKMEYKNSLTKLRKNVTEKKNKYCERTFQRMERYIGRNECSEDWRTLKNLRNIGQDKIHIPGISLN